MPGGRVHVPTGVTGPSDAVGDGSAGRGPESPAGPRRGTRRVIFVSSLIIAAFLYVLALLLERGEKAKRRREDERFHDRLFHPWKYPPTTDGKRRWDHLAGSTWPAWSSRADGGSGRR